MDISTLDSGHIAFLTLMRVKHLSFTCGRLLLIVAIYLASGDMAIAAQPLGWASNIVWTGIL